MEVPFIGTASIDQLVGIAHRKHARYVDRNRVEIVPIDDSDVGARRVVLARSDEDAAAARASARKSIDRMAGLRKARDRANEGVAGERDRARAIQGQSGACDEIIVGKRGVGATRAVTDVVDAFAGRNIRDVAEQRRRQGHFQPAHQDVGGKSALCGDLAVVENDVALDIEIVDEASLGVTVDAVRELPEYDVIGQVFFAGLILRVDAVAVPAIRCIPAVVKMMDP